MAYLCCSINSFLPPRRAASASDRLRKEESMPPLPEDTMREVVRTIYRASRQDRSVSGESERRSPTSRTTAQEASTSRSTSNGR
jgi:hypothetical protein